MSETQKNNLDSLNEIFIAVWYILNNLSKIS